MKTGNLELDKNKYLFGFYGFEVQFHHFYSGLEIWDKVTIRKEALSGIYIYTLDTKC